ncbi:Diamine acetyltransferase 2 [Gracilariopsis chorda]|uniref:Diamine acetyltransferase 2 n=1 Tax=Gracilariopsis chorda TaxID=448386 RepID=A0A2V3IJT8_9FLOR|nr:Diamine acetyltransferase 2 [Gracilariopsis chorda]|eukprot:PXF42364.1 Diamine acetyltransferase 2 [Gracilariopsis chorda]
MSSSATTVSPPHQQPHYRIRPCNDPSDAQQLYPLVQQLAQYQNLSNAVLTSVQTLTRDGFETTPPLFYSAFAEHKNNNQWTPVGFVVSYHAYDTWKGRTLIIEDLFVQEHHRRKGLGRKLFAHCIKLAFQTACAYVEWVVHNSNHRAKQMYISLGAHYPDGGVWDLMRMDAKAIETFMANPL